MEGMLEIEKLGKQSGITDASISNPIKEMEEVSRNLLSSKRDFENLIAIVTNVTVATTSAAVAGVSLMQTTAIAATLDCI